ncbi:hypothetical protein QBC42DRAFT_280064 [Cladorrhinum samala]|uniref:Uncharacterized protein n=1 Tax=Cladorrhinum samala TaxID=585594 RepID=A0AAV9HB80_9PEZI|nr:hypothetical protein QBC42DRAFT_280064 [Cladorrhinum samala]
MQSWIVPWAVLCVRLPSAIGATIIVAGDTKGPFMGRLMVVVVAGWLASCMDGMMGSHPHDLMVTLAP